MAIELATTQSDQGKVTRLSWADCKQLIREADKPGNIVYAVPRGGLCAAALMTEANLVTDPAEANIILDDIIDSGATRDRFITAYPSAEFVALVDKQKYTELGWVVFPWENETGPEDAVVRLLEYIGEDPKRDGLVNTPARVVKALGEMTSGNRDDPADILATTFAADCDEMVVVRNIPFYSLCEHHLLPFHGTATVGYIPTDRVVGLSKIARLVNCFGRRLQIQEQMTRQVVDAMMEYLDPVGAACVIKATHTCMAMRGIRSDGETVTSALAGAFLDKPEARAEFMSLAVKQ